MAKYSHPDPSTVKEEEEEPRHEEEGEEEHPEHIQITVAQWNEVQWKLQDYEQRLARLEQAGKGNSAKEEVEEPQVC